MKLRRRFFDGNEYKWQNTDEEITITNRDPSLAVSVDGAYDIYCMCTRINYEWRVVYISCDSLSQ